MRVYGAADLKPVGACASRSKGNELTLLGIADPQAQAGGDAVTTDAARLAGADHGATRSSSRHRRWASPARRRSTRRAGSSAWWR